MSRLFHWSSLSTAFLVLGVTTAVATPFIIPTSVLSQETTPTQTAPTTTPATNFPDVPQDYWAQPFIQALAARNVIVGFPDGTYRPNQAVTRAEFAAMIQKAFDQQQVRQLSPGGFRDVPPGYWAASAIQEAYETGFISGYPNNLFRPNQQIPKVQAIVALTSGLGLTTTTGTTSDILNTYSDASAIPSYAVNNVAAATNANLVVNYPNVNVLNPSVPLTRAEAAAHLYQALVRLGQVQPIPSTVAAANYIVGRTDGGTQTPDSTPTANDIVSVASSSPSFTTLTSLLKEAGLADTLQQQGPFTVFAPTDQAFAALPTGVLQKLQLPENKEVLTRILTYHVVGGQVTSAGAQTTLQGAPVNVRVTGANQIKVNQSNVTQASKTTNGTIYAIDQVLLPPDFEVSQLQGPAGDTDGTTIGRPTRGGRSYIAVGGNIGLGGDSALSEGNFAVMTKLGFSRNLSLRPSAVIGDDSILLVPVTLDFAPRSTVGQFSIAPYVGLGAGIELSDDADVGFLLTGGVDVPLASRFVLTGNVSAVFLDDTDVGLMLGVGYRF
ncbi:MAG: S-layer homology domain-containing protein [Scytonema sp. PMC 1069.18]|nr:S-layer homology domain-containing protein [Scytonema sp. PMC 1069.18]MEC4887675.1 S-layer homology domain-containing protein [Scytonema sp. PMC 1070.18]